MNELIIIVEGETEQTFVRDQLAAHLALHNTVAWPVLPGRRRSHGGVKKWEVAKQDIVRALKERRYCSTMFDYYAMPSDWPGREEATGKAWSERAGHVESMIQADIVNEMGGSFDPKFFIPYVQLHEFEALAFADIKKLVSVLAPIGKDSEEALAEKFNEILKAAGNPEAINDSYETCPSRRIGKIVPAYRKCLQGPIVTKRIGIDILREQCPHFGKWLVRLEQLGAEIR